MTTIPPYPVRAVIFDCDGVLVDSERLELVLMRKALGWLGVEADAAALQHRNRGGAMADLLADMERLHEAPLPEGFIERYRDEQLAGLVDVELVPGAAAAVDMVDDLGLPKAIGSGGPTAKMKVTLGAVGFWDRFAPHIFSCYDLDSGAHKPDPEIYLHAADAIDANPLECVVFEDSINGIGAGVAAGMYVVGLARDLPADALLGAGAATTIPSMDDAPELLKFLVQRTNDTEA